jgi:hypothetical protein
MLDFDANTVAAELDDLHQESFFENNVPKSLSRRPSFYYIQEADDGEVGEEEKDEDEEKEEDEDEIYGREKPSQRIFDDEAMALIHAGLAGIVIPSWIDRPPVNLGDKTHGKLKADNWFVLFSIFFPLIIPEIWWRHSSNHKLLLNFHDLVGAMHILCSYTTSPAEADRYTEMYSSYLYSSQSLFPGLTTRPNHHYALHNGDQLKWWGPLVKLAEFMYESHNGALQKIKTNNHMCKPEFNAANRLLT